MAAILTGCDAASQKVPAAQLEKLNVGLTSAETQADQIFTDVNRSTRDEERIAAVSGDAVGLDVKQLHATISPGARADWHSAFHALEQYVAGLQKLKAAANTNDFADATVALGQQLSTGITRTEINPSISTAVAQIGQALIDAKRERDLLAIMRKTDPAVRDVLTKMADQVGAEVKAGTLMGMVDAAWTTKLQEPADRFAAAKDKKDAQAAGTAFDQVYDGAADRDDVFVTLQSFRRSLLLLADAHTAASHGEPQTLETLIAQIDKQADLSKALLKKFEDANNATRSK